MADIYTERGLTETPTVNIGEMSTGSDVRRAGKIFDAIEEHAQQKANKYQKLATELYKGGSNLAIHQGLETLSNDPAYSSNPEAFAKEADKMASKVYSGIQNPEIKADVILNYELKKNSYINNAYTNYYKKQNEEQEYQVLSGINNEMKDYQVSVRNLLNGDFGVDDIRKIGESKSNFQKYINAKDVQGFDMFTAREKISMENSYDKNIVKAVSSAYDELPPQKKQEIANLVLEKGEVPSDVKGMLSEPAVKDLKKHIIETRDLEFKRQKHEMAMADFLKKQNIAQNEFALTTQIDGIEDPVEQLNVLNDNRDGVSEKYFKAKSRAIYSTLAITPKTNAETFSSLMKRIRSLDPNEASDFVESSDEILTRIEETVANGELLRSDKDILLKAMDKTEKPSVEKIGEGKSSFFSFGFDYDDAAKYIEGNSADESENYNLMLDYYRNINDKKYNSDERRAIMSAIVEKKNRELFGRGKTKSGSTLGMINEYFTNNIPQKYQQEARDEFLSRTSDLKGTTAEITSNYKKIAGEVSDGINQSIRLKAQDAYQQILDKSDDEIISSMAQKNGKSVEEFNKDIDETAQKYGLSRQQVINKLKGAY